MKTHLLDYNKASNSQFNMIGIEEFDFEPADFIRPIKEFQFRTFPSFFRMQNTMNIVDSEEAHTPLHLSYPNPLIILILIEPLIIPIDPSPSLPILLTSSHIIPTPDYHP